MTIQPKLPLKGTGLLYECANPECFYCGTLMSMEDVSWAEYWDTSAEDLLLRSVCPACREPMMIWEEDEK